LGRPENGGLGRDAEWSCEAKRGKTMRVRDPGVF